MVGKRNEFRSETDQFGEVQLPAGAYWGAATARAVDQLSTTAMAPLSELTAAIVTIKKVCALANADAQVLEPRVAQSICQSADEVAGGQWREQFIVDPMHAGGAGALVRNIDEVLANRSEEILGGTTGSYSKVHPTRHVALQQSSQHVYVSALRLALLQVLKEITPGILDLERLLRRKALELGKVDISGRAASKDAEITLGQKLNALASSIERGHRRLNDTLPYLAEFSLGSPQTGNAKASASACPTTARAIERLAEQTGFKFKQCEEPLRFIASMSDFVALSGSLSELASELLKLAADLRILASAPAGARAELSLAAGSNNNHKDKDALRALDALQMAACQVVGANAATAAAARAGQLDSNTLVPSIAFNLLQALAILKGALPLFSQRCVSNLGSGGAEFKSVEATPRNDDKMRGQAPASTNNMMFAPDTTGSVTSES